MSSTVTVTEVVASELRAQIESLQEKIVRREESLEWHTNNIKTFEDTFSKVARGECFLTANQKAQADKYCACVDRETVRAQQYLYSWQSIQNQIELKNAALLCFANRRAELDGLRPATPKVASPDKYAWTTPPPSSPIRRGKSQVHSWSLVLTP